MIYNSSIYKKLIFFEKKKNHFLNLFVLFFNVLFYLNTFFQVPVLGLTATSTANVTKWVNLRYNIEFKSLFATQHPFKGGNIKKGGLFKNVLCILLQNMHFLKSTLNNQIRDQGPALYNEENNASSKLYRIRKTVKVIQWDIFFASIWRFAFI